MHLYVHIPFCDGKCAYCGFYSTRYSCEKADGFISALERELERIPVDADAALRTIYFGGGTPSSLSGGQLARLTAMVAGRLPVADDVEWTVEGSPNTLSEDKVGILLDAGVNRISIGIQTFSDTALKAMGRRHTADEARAVIERLLSKPELMVGCDLIAGLPGVSREDWRKDVQSVCGLGLKHASVYGLSLEEGTRLFHEHSRGNVGLYSEDEVIDRLEESAEILGEAGIERYEVSNYAAEGCECRHNLVYWRGRDYYGAGPGASSRVGMVRRSNTPDVEAYIQAADAPHDEEVVSREEDLQERFIYHFRLREGINFKEFCVKRQVAAGLKEVWRLGLERFVEDGLLIKDGDRYQTTPRGMDFADAMAESFLE